MLYATLPWKPSVALLGKASVSVAPILARAPEPSFSEAFLASVHPGLVHILRRRGIACESDLANLRQCELVEFFGGILLEEDAVELIRVADSVFRRHLGKPLHQLSCQPVPHTAPQLKPVASSGN